MIGLRLDRRLQGIIDPSDVIQETFLVASKRLEEYVADPRLPPFLWLRFLTGQRLHELHEHHFKMKKRDERRKRSLETGQDRRWS